jgi:Macrocin-O-methyltransferase (TylF)
MTQDEASRFKETKIQAPEESDYRRSVGGYFEGSVCTTTEKLENFAKYVPRQALTQFLYRYEMFKRILLVQGSIIECGVLFGGGVMAWAQLSAILEPINHQRRVIGFDTFGGFVGIAPEDQKGTSSYLQPGAYAVDSYEDLEKGAALFDANRFLKHIPKVELVKGDISQTAPKYVEDNPHTVVSLLYVDLDLFEPTKAALQTFVPRMPKGAIIAFDQVNSPAWPGETIAVLDTLGVRNLRLERVPFETARCFAVLE